MNMQRTRRGGAIALVLAGLVAAFMPASAFAQGKAGKQKSADPMPKAETKPHEEPIKESLSKTLHEIQIGGAKIEYEATAGTLLVKDEDGKPDAGIFFISYVKTGVKDLGRRPITFCFNGGPGSSSVWLHLGAFGPRRVVVSEDGAPVAPYDFVDNPYSLLEATDLVFIDPVSTGYSRPAPGQEAKKFNGVDEDIRIVGRFIGQYVTRFERWDSPKFLAGESYGTTRASGLSRHLQSQLGMNLNGVILVSTVLNFQTISEQEGNELPYALFLPTYTATAWKHGKLDESLQKDRDKALAEAEKFALGEYSLALLQGSALPRAEADKVARKLARFAGLSEDLAKRSDLRIKAYRFREELLAKSHQVVGRYDSRIKGVASGPPGEQREYDPSYAAVQGPFTAALNRYVKNELKYSTELTYRILTDRVRPWDFGSKNRYLNVAPDLKQAMTENRGLRVFVASGYYDMATPYLATKYTFNHLGLDPSLSGNIVMRYYDAGHMMYTDVEQLQKLNRDLVAFVQAPTPQPTRGH
jgi:carboxypeptidase C (cathepsin A)